MIIVLTAGHSNSDPGAVGHGAKEAELMAELRNICTLKLRQLGHTVYTDGEGKDNKPLNHALELVRWHQPARAIELHMNAAANPSATGVETISLPRDKVLAQGISAGIAEVLGLRLRGDKGWIDQSQSARGRLGFVSVGGLIVEVAFISNAEDLRATQEKLWLVAGAIAHAVHAGSRP